MREPGEKVIEDGLGVIGRDEEDKFEFEAERHILVLVHRVYTVTVSEIAVRTQRFVAVADPIAICAVLNLQCPDDHPDTPRAIRLGNCIMLQLASYVDCPSYL